MINLGFLTFSQHRYVVGSAILSLLLVVYVCLGDRDFVNDFTWEDSWVESGTAVFFAMSFFICLFAVFKKRNVVLASVWLFLSLFFLGEEVSWFQRVFEFSVPWVENMNAQREFSFHNINAFQGGGIMNSSYKYNNFLNAQNLFRAGFFGYFLVLPILASLPFLQSFFSKVGYKVPHLFWTLSLLFVFSISFAAVFFIDVEMHRALAETREMLYSYFIMFYVYAYIYSPVTEHAIGSSK